MGNYTNEKFLNSLEILKKSHQRMMYFILSQTIIVKRKK